MNQSHPTESDWMMFLYEELEPGRREELAAHLAGCTTCGEQVAAWQNTMGELDDWQLAQPETNPIVRPPTIQSQPRGAWRTAMLVSCAFVGGLLLANFFTPSYEQLRNEVTAEVRAELGGEVRRLVADAAVRQPVSKHLVPVIQAESGRVFTTGLAAWEQKNSAQEQRVQRVLGDVLRNQLSLRKDLEALAIEAEAQILRTQGQLLRLQGSSQSRGQQVPGIRGSLPTTRG